MQRLRARLRAWLGIEAVEDQHQRLWENLRGLHHIVQAQKAAIPPTTTPSATATRSEPDFYDPVMGRL